MEPVARMEPVVGALGQNLKVAGELGVAASFRHGYGCFA